MIKGTPTCADEIPHSGDLPDALPERERKPTAEHRQWLEIQEPLGMKGRKTNAMKQERGKRKEVWERIRKAIVEK